MSDRHPWDIYADSLFHLGFGYPLWKPDPAPGCGEVDIGDVGWLENGEFHKLFNTTKAPDDPQPRGIPDGYRTFDVERAFIHGPREEIQQSVLCSRSIERLDASAGLTAAPSSLPSPVTPVSASTSFTFECSDDSGAMLVLHPSAVSKDIKSRKHVVAYIQSHFPEWMEFANGRFGLVLKDEQLMFVCGTTKTSRWAVAAFHGSYCKKQGSISANLSSTFAFDFSLAIANVQLPAAFYRVGPPQNGTHSSIPGRAMSDVTRDISWTQRDALNNDPLSHKFDQCIFIHYFKAKRRTFLPLQVLRAGAGPDQLPPGSDDIRDGKTPITAHHTMPDRGEAEYELFPPSQKPHDPVDEVLDYILTSSHAQVAIASDLDIHALYEGAVSREVPLIKLLQTCASVAVDADGFGTIIVHTANAVGKDLANDDLFAAVPVSTELENGMDKLAIAGSGEFGGTRNPYHDMHPLVDSQGSAAIATDDANPSPSPSESFRRRPAGAAWPQPGRSPGPTVGQRQWESQAQVREPPDSWSVPMQPLLARRAAIPVASLSQGSASIMTTPTDPWAPSPAWGLRGHTIHGAQLYPWGIFYMSPLQRPEWGSQAHLSESRTPEYWGIPSIVAPQIIGVPRTMMPPAYGIGRPRPLASRTPETDTDPPQKSHGDNLSLSPASPRSRRSRSESLSSIPSICSHDSGYASLKASVTGREDDEALKHRRPPREWRKGFSLSDITFSGLLKARYQANTSNDGGNEPKVTLHPYIRYTGLAKSPMMLDLRKPPNTIQFRALKDRQLTSWDMMRFVCEPPLQHMRFYHAHLPWYIDVGSQNPAGVTLYDMFTAIHMCMMTPIENADYYNVEMNSEARAQVADAWAARCRTEGERQQGIRRVDYLMGRCIMEGIQMGKDGMWEIRTRRTDPLVGFNSAEVIRRCESR